MGGVVYQQPQAVAAQQPVAYATPVVAQPVAKQF
jgi:hypothetical protein